MAFLCVCPEKTLEIAEEKNSNCSSVRQDLICGILQSVVFENNKKCIRVLSGGGIAAEVIGKVAKIALDGDLITALSGEIQNYAYLVKKYLHKELRLPHNITLEAIRQRFPITEAELLCKLYFQMGTTFLSKLRGKFAFCLYDSKTVKILAARDASGSVPLCQGQLSDNTLFIASGPYYPRDAMGVVDIEPGSYKFGWNAAQKKFTNPETEAKQTAEIASNAADEALAGLLLCKSPVTYSPKPRRLSLEVPVQNAKHSFETHAKLSRLSLDSSRNNHRGFAGESRCRKNGPNSHRADEHIWWRTSEKNSNDNFSSCHQQLENKNSHWKNLPEIDESPSKAKLKYENLVEDVIKMLMPDGDCNCDSGFIKMLRHLLSDKHKCALLVTDARDEDKVIFVNEIFTTDTGYTAEEIIGKNCRFLQAPVGKSVIASEESEEISKAIRESYPCSVQILNYKKDGTVLLNDLFVVPLRNATGTVTHRIGMPTFSKICKSHLMKTSMLVMNANGSLLKNKMTRSHSHRDLGTRQNLNFYVAAHYHTTSYFTF